MMINEAQGRLPDLKMQGTGAETCDLTGSSRNQEKWNKVSRARDSTRYSVPPPYGSVTLYGLHTFATSAAYTVTKGTGAAETPVE